MLFQLLTATVLLATASADVSPSAYDLQIGSIGKWSSPDDSPAYSYIDKDGTYYFQQSHAGYATGNSRIWSFFTGENMDSSTKSSLLTNYVNPSNPLDSNGNTTWRCNHSPTGKQSTAPPAGSGSQYTQPNFCDLVGLWVDPDTGDWIGLVHNEYTGSPYSDGLHFDAIDRAISTDQGKTWTITDRILTSQYPTVRGDNDAFPQQTYFWGNGDPRMTVDVASGYFYVTYGSRIINKGKGGSWVAFYSHVARAPMSSKLAVGSWHKFYDGQWNEPGVGGKESNLVPIDSSNSLGHTPPEKEYNPSTPGTAKDQINAGKMPATSPLFVMDVTWNAFLGLWVGEPQAVDQSGKAPQQFYATDDLTSQKWWLIGDTGSYTTASWYRWLLDPVSKTSSTIVGHNFRAYCSFGCSGGKSSEYIDIAINTTAPARPIDTIKTYTISTGGRFLGLDRNSAPTSGAFPDAKWTFAPTGDGAYTLTHTATKRVLGVTSRAWGTAPTAETATTPSVKQQWWILQNRDDKNALRGTFRLVNRYSGLVLALSGNNQRLVETTPGRAWTDTSASGVGGGRKADEQELTIVAV